MAKPKAGNPGFVRPEEDDRLFKASYPHLDAGTTHCNNCDPKEEVKRSPRHSDMPEVHYGVIASGNTLVKDTATRDRILELVGDSCLCIETEAAGLMDSFPCLVIRGISDYADSHKNDRWQRYAAATAAAYAKELLGIIPGEDIERSQKAVSILESS
jgi:nucleoside phosphorylase